MIIIIPWLTKWSAFDYIMCTQERRIEITKCIVDNLLMRTIWSIVATILINDYPRITNDFYFNMELEDIQINYFQFEEVWLPRTEMSTV